MRPLTEEETKAVFESEERRDNDTSRPKSD